MEQTTASFEYKTRKRVWKCRLHTGGHFEEASVCYQVHMDSYFMGSITKWFKRPIISDPAL